MESFGFQILQCLVTDLNPDAKVKAAMNQINEATRMREANKEKAEAEKIQLVKAAEADCDAKKLSGEGVAKQRKAIVDGTRTAFSSHHSHAHMHQLAHAPHTHTARFARRQIIARAPQHHERPTLLS
jgi:regulator of protease activity HflC (stomatin/prohibitin superfamily)